MHVVKHPTLNLGGRLRLSRVEANILTAEEMADLFAVARRTITNWETSAVTPSPRKIQRWAEIVAERTDYETGDLFTWLMEVHPTKPVTQITKISERRRQTERRTQRKERYTCSPVDRTEKRLADRHLQSVQLLAAS